MLKKLVNQANLDIRITPLDPLLIRSGQPTVGGVDMSFVRTYRFGDRAQPYIPGSSLKGVLRSYAEKICRSLRDQPVPVCLPYLKPDDAADGETGQASCGLRLEKYKKDHTVKMIATNQVYRLSCPICRLFGSHNFMGRLATADAYLADPPAVLEIRDGVAIDRHTGGAAPGAKYDLEVLTRGSFTTTVEIKNFERWQLGLLALVLRDMEDELVRLGFGKSRGLGRVRAEICRFQLVSYNAGLAGLSGLAGRCSQEEIDAYGLFPETPAPEAPLPEPQRDFLRFTYDITAGWRQVLEPAVADLVTYVSQVPWPQDLDEFVRRGGPA